MAESRSNVPVAIHRTERFRELALLHAARMENLEEEDENRRLKQRSSWQKTLCILKIKSWHFPSQLQKL